VKEVALEEMRSPSRSERESRCGRGEGIQLHLENAKLTRDCRNTWDSLVARVNRSISPTTPIPVPATLVKGTVVSY